MNPFLAALYELLRLIIRFGLRLFYRSYLLRGRGHLSTPAPLILVSNHPNTMMDVLNTVAFVPQRVKFLGNAGLFKNPIAAKLLSILYTIKVERPQDTDGKPVNNESAFQASIDCLKDGGSLYVAAEGSSFLNRQLREIKTGTARIALWTAAQTQFKQATHILPIGLSYEVPARFRKGLVVYAAPPIEVSSYREAYQYAPQDTVRALTREIRDALWDHSFSFESEADELIIGRAIEAFYGAEMYYSEAVFDQALQARNALLAFKEADHEAFARFEYAFSQWHARVLEHPKANLLLHPPLEQGPAPAWPLRAVTRLLALLGFVNQWLPTALLRAIVRKTDPYIGYYSTFWFAGGLVLYPFFFWLQYSAIRVLSGWGDWCLLYFLLAPATALIYHDSSESAQQRSHLKGARSADVSFLQLRAELDNMLAPLLRSALSRNHKAAEYKKRIKETGQ